MCQKRNQPKSAYTPRRVDALVSGDLRQLREAGRGIWPVDRARQTALDVGIDYARSDEVGRTEPSLWLRTRDLTEAWLRIGPVSSVSKTPESHRARERDLAVTAAAIMTRTAATTIAMIHRTQSMPGLPLPPSAV